jgi:hypothetical protein
MAANTSTNLLDRYVYAVSRYLAPYRQSDLLNELAANLHSEMEDKAAELGRPLTENEQADVLRRHGPPLLVAARYQPQRSLIGPELFPFYAFTITRLLPLVIGINLLAQAATIIFAPAQSPIAQRFHFGAMLGDLFSAVFMFLVIVTAGFALIEAYKVNVRRAIEQHKWDPRKLPKAQPIVHDGPRHPGADLVASIAFLAWLLLFPHYPVLIFGPYMAMRAFNLNIDLPAIWHTFYWFIVGFNVIQLVFRVLLLSQPMRRHYHAFESTLHGLGIGILVFLLSAHDYIGQATFGGNPMSPETVAALNANIHRGLLIVLIIAVIKFIWDTVQILRPQKAQQVPART